MRAFTLALSSFKQRQHDFGQLGREFFDGVVPSTPLLPSVIAGNCGLYHTLLVDAQGTVHSCGKGGGGRLGNGTEEDVYFPHPSFQLDPHLRSISCGSLHNAVVTSDGELYTWGFDSHGQAGCKGAGPMHDEDRNVLRPMQVLGCDEVDFKQVSCGGFHTMACDYAGNVYAWGKSDFGRCGIIPDRDKLESHLEDDIETPIWQPELVPTVSQISSLTCGGFFSMLVSDTRTELFSFGGNDNGELGFGRRSQFESTPRAVKLPLQHNGEYIDTVCCGAFHTAVLTSQGRVLTFGSNLNNQLGLGAKTPRSEIPVDMRLRDRITSIACGAQYTLLVTERQELWMVGANQPDPQFLHSSTSSALSLPPQQGLHHALFFEKP